MSEHVFGSPLTESDYQALERCGIHRETADAAPVTRADDYTGRVVAGREKRDLGEDFSGLLFGWRWPGRAGIRDYYLRRDNPPLEEKAGEVKETAKYLASPGSPNKLYLPPWIEAEWLTDIDLPLIITEGPKKVLALADLMWRISTEPDRPHALVVGISGVWNWRGKRGRRTGPKGQEQTLKGMIADLEQIALKDRSVTLLYDNDVQSNEKVKAARNKFAWALRDEGAEVFLVDIPSGPVKLGIDDVIGADGDVAAMKIIDSAYPHKTVNGKAKNGKANGEAKNGKTNGHAAPTIDPTPVTASNWHDEWVLTEKGNVAACLANAVSLLRYHGEWQGVLWFNEFTLEVVARNKAPWAGSRAGKIWADVDDSLATEWMQRHKVVIHSSKVVAEAIQMVAHEHPFHPLRDAVDALEWDGVPRLNEWLIKYAGAPETPYVRAVSAAWVISMMARLYMPGCKSDYVLGLEGDQDLGKSMFLEVLPGKGYFVDRLSNLDTKDAMLEMAGVWVIELSELDNMKGVRQEKFKGFVTSHTDRFRDPYGRRPSWHPRQCVLCSTTNLSEPFQDPTGMRRIWPVRCGRIDVPGLRSVRLQLLAEARVRFNPKSPAISLDGIEGDGERWWLEDYELKQLAYAEQEQRYEPGVWDDNIIEWIAAPTRRWDSDKHEGVKPWDYSGPGKVTITDVLVHCCEKEIGRLTQGDRNQVKRCLEHEKWRKYQDRSGDTRGKRFYYSPERWEKEFYKDGSRKGNE